MAQPPTQPKSAKMSFADVAARAPKQPASQPKTPGEVLDPNLFTRDVPTGPANKNSSSEPPRSGGNVPPSSDYLEQKLAVMTFEHRVRAMSKSAEASNRPQAGSLSMDSGLEDSKTQLSMCSNIAPSVSAKSMMSNTTFALDEKESIRPDDSASVRAAAEEDEFSSRRNSQGLNSRTNSDDDAPQSTKPMPLTGTTNGQLEAITTPMNAMAISQPVRTPNMSQIPVVVLDQGIHAQPHLPDEKILNALTTPKDRLFLLKLEEKIIVFIHDPSTSVLELPPSNSFWRLLAHRLADYYSLSHVVDASQGTVKLYRTAYCKNMPISLRTFVQSQARDSSPASGPSVKIMRRDNGLVFGQMTDSVIHPGGHSSKPASDFDDGRSGQDGQGRQGSNTNSERPAQTREEREAKYHETRARIFKDVPESGATTNDHSGNASAVGSRTSSNNGKRKKKLRNQNSDDNFDPRSAYNVYYPSTMQSPNSMMPGNANGTTYFAYPNQTQMQTMPFGQNGSYDPNMQMYQPVQQQFAYPQAQFNGQQLIQQKQQYMQMNPMMQPQQNQQMYGFQPNMNGQQMQVPNNFYSNGQIGMMPQQQQATNGQMMQSYSSSPAPIQMQNPMSSPVMSQVSLNSGNARDQPWQAQSYQNTFQTWPNQQQQQQQQQMQAQNNVQQMMPIQNNQYAQMMPFQQNMQGMAYPGGSPNQMPMDMNAFRQQAFNPMSRAFVPQSHGSGSSNLGTGRKSKGQKGGSVVGGQNQSNGQNKGGNPRHNNLSKWQTPSTTLPPKPPPVAGTASQTSRSEK